MLKTRIGTCYDGLWLVSVTVSMFLVSCHHGLRVAHTYPSVDLIMESRTNSGLKFEDIHALVIRAPEDER